MVQDLTPRQLEMVLHLSNGLRVTEIAKQLNLSLSSARKTLNAARRRSGAKTLPHLVSLAIGCDLLVFNSDDKTHQINTNGKMPRGAKL